MSRFTDSEIKEMKTVFNSFDEDGNGSIDVNELKKVLTNLKMYENLDQLSDLIREVDSDKSGTIEFTEFLDVVHNLKTKKSSATSGFARVYTKQKDLVQVKGASGHHSFAVEEMSAFAEHLNNCLGDDPDLKHLLPIETKGLDLCKKVGDGILLAKFINLAEPGTIDERALNKKKSTKELSLFQVNENLNLVISAATSIGVKTVNVGATELREGENSPHLVLGMVWQLVKIQLLNSINLKNHPELIRLLKEGETLEDLLRLPPEKLLLRWFNYHLENAAWPKRVKNFSSDLKDATAYTVLLSQVDKKTSRAGLDVKDVSERAGMVITNAKALGVQTFIKPRDIVAGNPRLNLAFTAAVFNQCPGLEELTEEELEKAGLMDDDFGDSREERAFRMWMNSLGIDDVYVNSLFEDLKDGLVLLRVIDHIEPATVAWRKVEKKTNNKFKKVGNNNYVILLGKQLRFSLVNIGGTDLVDGHKKLTLAYVWQLMRYHTIKYIAEAQKKTFGGRPVTEADMIKWANDRVAASGRESKMRNFSDPSLANGIFFLDLLAAIEPRIIDPEFVTAGETDEDRLLNARYAISVARKLQATIFLLPEDITEVKKKMILTFIGSIMAISG